MQDANIAPVAAVVEEKKSAEVSVYPTLITDMRYALPSI